MDPFLEPNLMKFHALNKLTEFSVSEGIAFLLAKAIDATQMMTISCLDFQHWMAREILKRCHVTPSIWRMMTPTNQMPISSNVQFIPITDVSRPGDSFFQETKIPFDITRVVVRTHLKFLGSKASL